MRGDSKIALAFLAIGFAPALIKRSKHMSRYIGDHLVRAGEYFLHEEEPAQVETVVTEAATAPPVVEIPVVVPEDLVEPEMIGSETIEGEMVAETPTDPTPESVTGESIEGETHQSWD